MQTHLPVKLFEPRAWLRSADLEGTIFIRLPSSLALHLLALGRCPKAVVSPGLEQDVLNAWNTQVACH
jgi:hypothetical protein